MEATLSYRNGQIEIISEKNGDTAQLSIEANGEDCFIDLSKNEIKNLIIHLQDAYNNLKWE